MWVRVFLKKNGNEILEIQKKNIEVLDPRSWMWSTFYFSISAWIGMWIVTSFHILMLEVPSVQTPIPRTNVSGYTDIISKTELLVSIMREKEISGN